jgi:GGDEF domain-containing protein
LRGPPVEARLAVMLLDMDGLKQINAATGMPRATPP